MLQSQTLLNYPLSKMTTNIQGTSSKIKEIEELAEIVASVQKKGKKVVHCHGVFDLLHIGHIRYFEQAKTKGDMLVVTMTPDKFVNKGPSRPAFSETLRAEAIAALDCVDLVSINKWPMAVETIHLIRPDFYVKGSDYKAAENDLTGGIQLEQAAINEVGGQLVFTDDITFSASNLINQHFSALPKVAGEYLSKFSNKYKSDDVIKWVEESSSLKVLVIGETIIDEYQYCDTLGKTGKEPVLAAKAGEIERFAGGVIAIGNHASALSDQVSILSFLGGVDSQEEFIRERMNPNIDGMFIFMGGDAPTIVKRRFVERYPFRTIFELYVMDNHEHRPVESKALCDKLLEELPKYDLVIVADYGHGMLGPDAVEILCSHARFLAINTQVNADNRGFNNVSKYRRADFISVSENEIRLEVRDRQKDLRQIVLEVSEKLSCDRIIITRGATGCLSYSRKDGFFEIPAFATQVVDRVGAGDAVFSMASLCVAQGAPMEVVGFIASTVGAEAVATVGHRISTQRVPLLRHIETILK